MKKYFQLLILVLFIFNGCALKHIGEESIYRQRMRIFVKRIARYARKTNADFIVIPQNGQELLVIGDDLAQPEMEYIDIIDGIGREDLLYGYESTDQQTPTSEKNYFIDLCDVATENNVKVLVTDYCSTHSYMDDSYQTNRSLGYISFAAPERELNVIPDYPVSPYRENNNKITKLSQAKNFLYLINPDQYSSKSSFINDIAATNYDVVIVDLFFHDNELTSADLQKLKQKANGANRLVIAYMSIGEAENYRYYWRNSWNTFAPLWLDEENPNWEGNYKVKFWKLGWQYLITGNKQSYVQKILDAGFDGVYLDIIDAFEYYEE
ncbi:MAG: endo alpha-1,4 polygalactosaminidase [Spirochaetes bacterium]|nr:endo alpha-1,4 polygalactosaminidase [Spirochaetota bacterium]